MIRPVETDTDLERWVAIRNAVVPNEPTTAEATRASADPERLLLLAGDAGCGIAERSGFGGRAFIAVRVLPEQRRRGIGTALYLELAKHGRSLGLEGVNAFVYADEPHSIAFAERLGLTEVDYQLEQIRSVGDEPAPVPVDGIDIEPLDGRREELLEAVWPIALEGYADLPVPGEVTYKLETWLREEATRPDGSFVAWENGEPIGYAGLMEHANGTATAENGLTVVRRDHRQRGIGRLLKQSQLHWASRAGVLEIVTWTQKGNEAMQTLNRSIGYVDKSKVITFQGPLP
ncbi:MAG TPA: GNAT family N-acetyltransferase [Gaiellaceae bacterium]|jgi:mycothiol synthase|nr:GNAT family N-acetyltransferase [Gaiellaceae bacterium]